MQSQKMKRRIKKRKREACAENKNKQTKHKSSLKDLKRRIRLNITLKFLKRNRVTRQLVQEPLT